MEHDVITDINYINFHKCGHILHRHFGTSTFSVATGCGAVIMLAVSVSLRLIKGNTSYSDYKWQTKRSGRK
jgi:hypothetical protein